MLPTHAPPGARALHAGCTGSLPPWRLQHMHGDRGAGVLDPDKLLLAPSYKYLGVTFSSSLSWADHVEDILPKISAAVDQLKATVLHCDVLAPRTAMDVFRRYVVTQVLHGSAIWGPSQFFRTTAATARLSTHHSNKLDHKLNSSLRAILGVHESACLPALHRELGWEGLKTRFASAKLSLVRKVLGQPVLSPARLSLKDAFDRATAANANGRLAHRDKSNGGSLSSYFYNDALCVLHAVNEHLSFRSFLLANSGTWSHDAATAMRKHLLVAATTAALPDFQSKSTAANYPPGMAHAMALDVALAENAAPRAEYLLAAQIRCGGHALGCLVHSVSNPFGDPEICPCCKKGTSDTPGHFLLSCCYEPLILVRQKRWPPLRDLVDSLSAGWSARVAGSDRPAAFILSAGNIPTLTPEQREQVVRKLNDWLQDARDAHVTYSRFTHAKRITCLGAGIYRQSKRNNRGTPTRKPWLSRSSML